jgi:hypothetical protein
VIAREGRNMNFARTIGRIAAVLATVGALMALAGVAQAEGSVPRGMTADEYRALMLRSEALNHEYGLGEQTAAVVTSLPTNPPGASRGTRSGSAPP